MICNYSNHLIFKKIPFILNQDLKYLNIYYFLVLQNNNFKKQKNIKLFLFTLFVQKVKKQTEGYKHWNTTVIIIQQ